MKFIGAHIFDYDATFRGDVTIEGNLTISNSVSQTISFGDNDKLKFGDGNDLEIYHDASNSYIDQVGTGDLILRNSANDKDIIFQSDDGSGGVETFFFLDGSHGGNPITMFPDNSALNFGSTLGDLKISHDGSNSTINNGTGSLVLRQSVDDGDLILQCDDGSGGTTAYLTLDGSATELVASKNLRFDYDNSNIKFGGNNTFVGELSNSNKLQLRGGGSNTAATVYIDNSGNMGLGTSAPSSKLDVRGTVQVGVDDTGHDVIFYGATSGRYLQWDESQDRLEFTDNVRAVFGDNADLHIHHDGSNTYIQQQDGKTGSIIIEQQTNDADIVLRSDDGSGGQDPYVTIDGSAAKTKFSKFTLHEDNVKAEFGNSADLQIFHDGTHGQITNNSSNLFIKNNTDDGDIVFQCDDGSGGTTTYFSLDGSDAKNRFLKPIEVGANGAGHDVKFFLAASGRHIILDADDNSLIFTDNASAKFGNGGDLQLMHDGTDSRIDNMVGHLKIRNYSDNSDIIFETDNGSGATTTYLTLDGGENEIYFHKPVGIGTTNPDTAYKLDVAGKVQVQSVLELDDVLTLNAISTPADPAANKSSIYMDSADGAIKVKINVGGTVVTRTIASYE